MHSRVMMQSTIQWYASTSHLTYVCDMLFSQGPHVVSKGMVSFLLALGSLAPVTACSKKPVIKALALSFTVGERKKGLCHETLALIPNLAIEDFFKLQS